MHGLTWQKKKKKSNSGYVDGGMYKLKIRYVLQKKEVKEERGIKRIELTCQAVKCLIESKDDSCDSLLHKHRAADPR